MKEKKLLVSTSPHISAHHTTRSIMLDVIIALCPVLICSVVFFGLNTLCIVLLAIVSAVLGELLFNIIAKQKWTVMDLSAVVTGMILGLNIPAGNIGSVWYLPVIGGFFATMIVKMLFGGIGKNFANPAVTARIFLFIAFGSMAAYSGLSGFLGDVLYANSGATPLAAIKGTFNGLWSVGDPMGSIASINYIDLLIGNYGGVAGETATLAILIGAAYLIVRKVSNWQIPLIFVGTVFVLTFAFTGSLDFALISILSGGLMFGAVFMATDYASSPKSNLGVYIYAAGMGLITVVIRLFTGLPEGVSFAILLMNIASPLFDKFFIHRAFGGGKK
jgi:electron transport complex protein RnfD